MDDVVHVGDRKDLPRVTSNGARPVPEFFGEICPEELIFITDYIAEINYALTHYRP